MLTTLGLDSLDQLIDQTIPSSIRASEPLSLGDGVITGREPGEREVLEQLRDMVSANQLKRSLIGMGYYDTITPPVIQRNILENPGWYTQYTPYQAEIAQGRLEALLNFQTMVSGSPGCRSPTRRCSTRRRPPPRRCAMACRGASATSALVADNCHPQTIAVVQTRAEAARHRRDGRRSVDSFDCPRRPTRNWPPCSCSTRRPTGAIVDSQRAVRAAPTRPARKVIVATDLLALTVLRAPGSSSAPTSPSARPSASACRSATADRTPASWRARVVQAQAARAHRRRVEGRPRPAGVPAGHADARAAHPPREGDEQHLHRAGAAGDHGGDVRRLPRARRAAAHRERVRALTCGLAEGLRAPRSTTRAPTTGDSSTRSASSSRDVRPARCLEAARAAGFNLRPAGDGAVGLSLDEVTTPDDARADPRGVLGLSSATDGSVRRGARRRPRARCPSPTGARSTTSSTRCSTATTPRHEMLRYIHRCRRATSR